ncbi:hypothetical protein [Kribbella sp. NPDC051620]|uniref:hypothetical protein n=1 Tax=Kribbella sp. NPDC051620 TaxID=3364120 RepID=UPI0037B9271F
MGEDEMARWRAGAEGAEPELARRLRALWAIVTVPAPLATEQGDEEALDRLISCSPRPRRIRRRCRYRERT